MAKKYSKSGKKQRTQRRRQRQSGGGWGFTGAGSIPGTPGTVSNPLVYTGIGDCRAVKPGYDIPYSQYGASFKGLPGMSGGGKRKSTRRGKGRKTRRALRQRGGRYGFAPEGITGVTPSGATPWAGTYAPIQRIACEGSTPNPLNLGPHTPSTQPLPVAPSRIPMPQGGGGQMAPATYGVGNVDSMYYYAPTGGYANAASTWKDSVGAPVQIQVPYAARAMNQACLTTGGAPPLTGALQTGGRRSRKQRQRGGASLDPSTWGNAITAATSAVRQRLTNMAALAGLGAGAANVGAPGANVGPPGANVGPPGVNVGPPGVNVGPPAAGPEEELGGMNGDTNEGNEGNGEPSAKRPRLEGGRGRHRKHKKGTHKRHRKH